MSGPERRLHTLLTERAIAGLDEAERAELRHLLAGAAIDPSYESAAAAIELALMAHAQAMPEAITAAVIEQADSYWGFTGARRHEQTTGRPSSPAGLDVDDAEDDELLVDDLLLGAGPHPARGEGPGLGAPESIDDAIESGVLESSLTNLRFDRSERPAGGGAKSARSSRRPSSRPEPSPKPSPEPSPELEADPEPEHEPGSGLDIDPRAISQSDLGPAVSRSGVVHVPISESRVIRVATYVSAIAALVMLSIALWLFVHRDDPPDAEDLRAQIEATSDKIEWNFTIKRDPAVSEDASGSVLWSSEAQTGVLILQGLAATGTGGAGGTQYQLWIIDSKREGPPVDGGVFDVPEDTGELQIPVDAKLLIGEPRAFLITVERPGGVVVSGQARVVMVATPG